MRIVNDGASNSEAATITPIWRREGLNELELLNRLDDLGRLEDFDRLDFQDRPAFHFMELLPSGVRFREVIGPAQFSDELLLVPLFLLLAALLRSHFIQVGEWRQRSGRGRWQCDWWLDRGHSWGICGQRRLEGFWLGLERCRPKIPKHTTGQKQEQGTRTGEELEPVPSAGRQAWGLGNCFPRAWKRLNGAERDCILAMGAIDPLAQPTGFKIYRPITDRAQCIKAFERIHKRLWFMVFVGWPIHHLIPLTLFYHPWGKRQV